MTDAELIEAIQRTKLEIGIMQERLVRYQEDAIARLKDHEIAGYRLGERYGNRTWSVESSIVRFMLSGFDVMTLKSPAQLEEMGVEGTVITSLTTRPFIGHYIARVK